jgi:hypothetical protein
VEDGISTVHGKLNKDREQLKDRLSRARKVSARQGRAGQGRVGQGRVGQGRTG